MTDMKNTLIQVSIFCALVITMAYIGPQLDDHGPEHEVAVEELAKQHRQDRFEKAAAEICGPNAGWSLTTNQDAIVCKTKRGHKTGRVAQL